MTPTIAILGGGPAGLVAARTACQVLKHTASVTVLESQPRLGGWISAVRSPTSGVLFERGPHSMRPRTRGNGKRLVDLICQVMNEEDTILTASASDRLIWHQDKLVVLPTSFMSMFTNPFTRRLPVEGIRNVCMMPIVPPHDESIRQFFTRNFSQQTADELVSAIVSGVFAGDTANLSIRSCFPDLYRACKRGHGSLIRGMMLESLFTPSSPSTSAAAAASKSLQSSSSFSFVGGLMDFVRMMERHLEQQNNVSVLINEEITRVRRQKTQDKSSSWIVETVSGRIIEASHVISTLSANTLLACLESPPVSLTRLSHSVGTVDVAVVNLAYAHEKPRHAGFGHLVSSAKEQAKTGALGIIYDSIVFPQQQPMEFSQRGCVLSVMLGGAHAGEWVSQLSNSELVNLATEVVHKHLGFVTLPSESLASLHRQCIPQYRVGHAEVASTVKDDLAKQRMLMLGTSVSGVGLADAVGGTMSEVAEFLTMRRSSL